MLGGEAFNENEFFVSCTKLAWMRAEACNVGFRWGGAVGVVAGYDLVHEASTLQLQITK